VDLAPIVSVVTSVKSVYFEDRFKICIYIFSILDIEIELYVREAETLLQNTIGKVLLHFQLCAVSEHFLVECDVVLFG
jgi:hypothetical protein